jgi:hypothetical protein
MSTLFVQLTDLHIREPGRLAYGRLDTAPYLRRAVQTIEQLRQKPHAVRLGLPPALKAGPTTSRRPCTFA